MQKFARGVLISSILALASSYTVAAYADTGSNVAKAEKQAGVPEDSARASALLAAQLEQYGDKNKDALALILAAKIQKQIGARIKQVEKTEQDGDKQADKGKPALDPSVKGLLARAKKYAGSRKDLIAMADDVEAFGSRGRAEGPFMGETVVRAHTTDQIPVTLNAHETAKVGISGDGDTDLDLFLYDENGNEVCSSTRSGDDEYCEVRPRWTGRFYIRVKNYGSVSNRYTLLLN